MQLRVVQHYILLLEFNAFIQLQILLLLMSCLQTCYLFLLSNFHNQMHTMYHDITSLFYCLSGNIHIMKVNISISCIRMAMSYIYGKVQKHHCTISFLDTKLLIIRSQTNKPFIKMTQIFKNVSFLGNIQKRKLVHFVYLGESNHVLVSFPLWFQVNE